MADDFDWNSYPLIRRFTVRICEDCFHLRGEMCSTPDCVFCWRSMPDVGKALDVMLIRPLVDGERLTADEGEPEPRLTPAEGR